MVGKSKSFSVQLYKSRIYCSSLFGEGRNTWYLVPTFKSHISRHSLQCAYPAWERGCFLLADTVAVGLTPASVNEVGSSLGSVLLTAAFGSLTV